MARRKRNSNSGQGVMLGIAGMNGAGSLMSRMGRRCL